MGRLTGWGFSTTQQPSLCQNSLMFPDGSSFTLLPEAPEGSCSGALTAHSSLPAGVTTTWVHSARRGQRKESPRNLSWAAKASVSDPEKPAGPGSELGRQAHASLPQAWNPGGAESGERRKVNEGTPPSLRSPLKSSDSCSPLKALVLYPTLTSSNVRTSQ